VPALYEHPVVLGGALVALVLAGAAAGVGRDLAAAARLGVPLVLLVTLVNPLVYNEGATLLVRGGTVLGRRVDITFEALAFGAVAGLRVLVLMLAFALLSAVVDPDELLRSLRRFSYRSALTAALATRLVPVLARDATRMGEAARCRPLPPGRAAVARAALTRALERAGDAASALELRGYSSAHRPRATRRSRSRHDRRVAFAAALIAGAAIAGKLASVGWIEPYPTLQLALGPGEAALAAGLVAFTHAPFAGASGRMGVAPAEHGGLARA
jgi:energy-coupling factor transport system permease protein